MRCLDCHYSLKNLTEHRCPECGRPFDPNNPRSFLHVDSEKPGTAVLMAIGVGLIVVPVVFIALLFLVGYLLSHPFG